MKKTLGLLLVASLIVGCGSDGTAPVALSANAKSFVGTWVGQIEWSDQDIAKMRTMMSEEEVQASLEMVKEVQPTLELLEDGTFQMSSSFDPEPLKDTWKVEGDTLVLASSGSSTSWSGKQGEEMPDLSELEKIPNKEPLVLKIESDGTELVMTDMDGEMTSRVVYTRK